MDISNFRFFAYILGRRTRPPRSYITLDMNGNLVKLSNKPLPLWGVPTWWQAQLFKAIAGAVWLGICILALTVLLTLADIWVKGG